MEFCLLIKRKRKFSCGAFELSFKHLETGYSNWGCAVSPVRVYEVARLGQAQLIASLYPSFCPSIRPSTSNNVAPTANVAMKIRI
jgi:hypothetical protein